MGEEETKRGRGQKNRWERPKEKGKRGEQGDRGKKKRKKEKREPVRRPPFVKKRAVVGRRTMPEQCFARKCYVRQAGRLCLLLLLLTGKAKQSKASNLSQHTTTNPSHPTHHPPRAFEQPANLLDRSTACTQLLGNSWLPTTLLFAMPVTARESKVRCPFGPLCCCCSSFSFFFCPLRCCFTPTAGTT